MNSRHFRVLLTALLFSSVLLGHHAYCQKEARLYEKGLAHLNQHKYILAYRYFALAQETNPDFEDIAYKTELSALLSGENDEGSIDKMISYEGQYAETDDHYYYWMGQIFLRRYQIDAAVSAFERFKNRVTYLDNDESATLEMLEHIDDLNAYFENPNDYEVYHLESPVNSKGSEMSPVYFEESNELLFASDRDAANDQPFSIYYSMSNDQGWSPATKVDQLGTFTRHNANIEVLNSSKKLFLFNEENGGDIQFSHSSGDSWTTPVQFDSRVTNKHLDAHFFINQHEDRIIFSSENKGSGLDLHESFLDLENDKWSSPAPFYEGLNSEFDEDCPYLTPDEQTVYFSSNRPGGLGGYDIYVSRLDNSTYQWSEPENMGWPINSPNDELHFKMNGDGASGYFVSDRLHTLGGSDIYFFRKIEKVGIQGRIFNTAINGPLTNAEIRFHPAQYLDESFTSSIDQNGRYKTMIIADEVLKVEIIKNDQVIYMEHFRTEKTTGEPTTHVKDFTIQFDQSFEK